MYNSRRYNNKDDSDSDDNNRFRSSTSNNYGNNNYSYARTSTLGNTNDRYATSYRSPSAYATSGRSGKYSDSDDNLASSSNRYGANTRRSVVRHSDSEDSDRYDSRRSTSVRRGGLSARPGSSRRDYDSDSYDSANQKLKMMMQMEKSLVEELDELYENKLAKEKKIEQLKDEIQRDTIKEDNIRKKLNDVRFKRKALQNRLDEMK